MTTIRCNAWAAVILGLALLADVAPGGCGSRPAPRLRTTLDIVASDCSCAQGTLQVSIDSRPVGALTCGATGKLPVAVEAGAHVVTAQSPTAAWPPKSVEAAEGRSTPVELGCPAS